MAHEKHMTVEMFENLTPNELAGIYGETDGNSHMRMMDDLSALLVKS